MFRFLSSLFFRFRRPDIWQIAWLWPVELTIPYRVFAEKVWAMGRKNAFVRKPFGRWIQIAKIIKTSLSIKCIVWNKFINFIETGIFESALYPLITNKKSVNRKLTLKPFPHLGSRVIVPRRFSLLSLVNYAITAWPSRFAKWALKLPFTQSIEYLQNLHSLLAESFVV